MSDELTQTQKINIFRHGIRHVAVTWEQNLSPLPYEEDVNVDGSIVRVTVQYKHDAITQRLSLYGEKDQLD